jgi:hypothetical protein
MQGGRSGSNFGTLPRPSMEMTACNKLQRTGPARMGLAAELGVHRHLWVTSAATLFSGAQAETVFGARVAGDPRWRPILQSVSSTTRCSSQPWSRLSLSVQISTRRCARWLFFQDAASSEAFDRVGIDTDGSRFTIQPRSRWA